MKPEPQPSAIDLLDAIEARGFALTLELRCTAKKWASGQNLFLGLLGANGLPVRNAYGAIEIEMPRRVGDRLAWAADDGQRATTLSQALRITLRRGLVRRGSHIHNALQALTPFAR